MQIHLRIYERSWKNITYVYKELGLIGTPVRFDEVMDSVSLKISMRKRPLRI
jgi:hypothetical protein